MNLQTLVNTSYGTGAGIALGRLLPPGPGYALARWLADLGATRRRATWLRALRANQWVAGGRRLDAHELDQAGRAVLRHQAHCLFDLYHTRHNPEALQRLSPPTPQMDALIERSRGGREGAMVVFPHLSNFDVFFVANAYRGLTAQMLTIGQPSSGYRMQNRVRTAAAFEITPIDDASTALAVERLKRGGLVVTGIDRPIPGKKHMLSFFGRPSPLPAGYVRMALAADVPVIVVATTMQPDGHYQAHVSEPIHMVRYADAAAEIRYNAQAVLEVLAGYIARAPHQWLMYYPVWPAALDEVPEA